ncbi:VOC family protein [Arthrobacter sp. C152]
MAKLFAYLSYADAPGALAWLAGIGFDVVRRMDGADGTVIHAEMRMGEAVLMVASNDAPYGTPGLAGRSTGQGLYLLVDDVDALHGRAVELGGTSVIPPEDTEWGSRRARVLDPGGREWSFGSYEPGVGW